jgi:hypothetical protein
MLILQHYKLNSILQFIIIIYNELENGRYNYFTNLIFLGIFELYSFHLETASFLPLMFMLAARLSFFVAQL